jgi:hypothetical protein
MNSTTPKKINPTLWSVQLLGLWGRISQIHLGMGLGCQCSGEMPGLAVSDLELNVMDYLHDKYQHDREFTQWLALHTDYQKGQSASVASFLKAMATQTPSRPLAIGLLKDLSQTLESLQQAHAA